MAAPIVRAPAGPHFALANPPPFPLHSPNANTSYLRWSSRHLPLHDGVRRLEHDDALLNIDVIVHIFHIDIDIVGRRKWRRRR